MASCYSCVDYGNFLLILSDWWTFSLFLKFIIVYAKNIREPNPKAFANPNSASTSRLKIKAQKRLCFTFFCSLIMMVLTWKGKSLWIYWPDSWWSLNIIQSWQSTCFFFYVQKKIVHYPFYSNFKNHALSKFTQEPGYLL